MEINETEGGVEDPTRPHRTVPQSSTAALPECGTVRLCKSGTPPTKKPPPGGGGWRAQRRCEKQVFHSDPEVRTCFRDSTWILNVYPTPSSRSEERRVGKEGRYRLVCE